MKKNIMIYTIILVLACVLTGATTYILIDKKDNKTEIKENDHKLNNNEENKNQNNNDKKDNNEEPTKQDGVKLVKTYNLNDKIIEEFEITLNGKTKIMNINFAHEEVEDPIIDGTFNDIYFYSRGFDSSEIKSMFTINSLKKEFNENNFKFIKGTDNKNYLLVISVGMHNELELLVLNDDFINIADNIREDEISGQTGFNITYYVEHSEANNNIWYQNTFNVKIKDFISEGMKANIHIKVEDNKIYFLNPVFDYKDETNWGYLEERVYTINNSKLSYEIINKYTITGVANQV